MSETYGSAGLRVACLHDGRGKNIKGESLFLNLDDHWVLIYAGFRFNWIE